MAWQFGPYRVDGVIARGGMGEILRAYDTRHDRIVALKVLAEHAAADPEFRERFKREAHAAARLNEPHVVPIHSYGEIDGRMYLDMRLVDGGDVGSRLAGAGPMPAAEAVGVVEQVAQALDAAHAQGLVHRDVKPSNILLGEHGFAYLVDFGIAHSVRTGTTLTSTGFAIGTLDYMAPERFDGSPGDPRSDVYSLACVLHQCLTGAKPFAGDTAASMINAHLNHPPPRPTSLRSAVPPGFDRIVQRGMAKNPDHRFAGAGELARAARAALTSPVPLGSDAVAGEPSRGPRRWPWLAAVAAVVVVGAVAALLASRPTEIAGRVAAPEGPPSAAATSAPTSASAEVPATSPGLEPPPRTEAESEPAVPRATRYCRTLEHGGVARGTGCFKPYGDRVYAHDTRADGMSIRTDVATDYGRTEECRDIGSGGPEVECEFNLSEKGRMRFQVELWDDGKRVTETRWTEYFPIGR
ncbi:serine/threonine-protein kinase [Saccharopolyspora sp. CA-218241]|uniref:serine/threonine-protein kinase n=1 Tax=Saccharopolyspora sp. CA-218241 TaxID=3240027 RepID=UPI003D9802D0